jgi:hydroxypyruvate reductase
MELYDAAVKAASPGVLTSRAIDAVSINRASRVWLFAFGKAAAPMATAAVTSLLRSLHAIVGGVVVSADDAPSPYPTLVAMRGDHPVPGRHSFAAATKIAEVSAGRRGNDVAIVLMSGGASSLIGAPLKGLNESDYTLLFEMLLGSGLDIAAVNAVRKRFSRWGAGRLALALAPAVTYCFAISDVANDDLAVIGSGPCVADETTAKDVVAILEKAGLLGRVPGSLRDYLTAVTRGTIPDTPTSSHPAFAHVTARVIGSNRMAVDGAAALARDKGYAVDILEPRLSGDAARAGEAIARHVLEKRNDEKRCFIWGGETTVTLAPGAHAGGGGRCQELALAAARVLHDAGDAGAGISILAAGTDGRDGATEAAGAIADSSTWSAIASNGRDPAQALVSHESNSALRAAGALIPRRETGTNVNDVVIAV